MSNKIRGIEYYMNMSKKKEYYMKFCLLIILHMTKKKVEKRTGLGILPNYLFVNAGKHRQE